jgi:thiamine biosynthesis lipoprotein
MIANSHRTFRAMGTDCRVAAFGSAGGDRRVAVAVSAALAEIALCERVLSRFDPASDLSRANAGAGAWIGVHPILTDALAHALTAREDTDGLYDPTILPALVAAGYDRSFDQLAGTERLPRARPAAWRAGATVRVDSQGQRVRMPAGTGIDLGGIGKGYSATRAVHAMLRAVPDLPGALVDLGGDIAFSGQPPGGGPWRVGVADPRTTGAQLGVLALRSGGVATSGRDRRRFGPGSGLHHLIDPATGLPAAPGPLTVTVVAPSTTIAETHATALAILPVERAAAFIERRPHISALLVQRDGSVLRLGDLPLERRLVVRFPVPA